MRFSIFVNITSYFVLIFISLETSDLCCKQLCFLDRYFFHCLCMWLCFSLDAQTGGITLETVVTAGFSQSQRHCFGNTGAMICQRLGCMHVCPQQTAENKTKITSIGHFISRLLFVLVIVKYLSHSLGTFIINITTSFTLILFNTECILFFFYLDVNVLR